MYLGVVIVGFTTCPAGTPRLYIVWQNIGEEGEMYFPFASAPILYVTPRNAAGYGRGRSENLSLC